jgi:DNA-binding NtrC family response regulator
MRALRACIERAAPSDCSVLLTGETGTGKGEIARAVHRGSSRAAGPFVHVNCAALSPGVIESELFGHERGAFTDASMRRSGRFEQADDGTLFLDEVAELAADLQAKLLRVLHDRSYERVGGSAPLTMRARVVAATNRSLQAEVRAGRFRSDLYYRLAVVELELPPLRQRLDDLPALIDAIRRSLAARLGVAVGAPTAAACDVLGRHAWPGNVRELVNLLERVAICWPERIFDREVALLALGAQAGPGQAPRSLSQEVPVFDLGTVAEGLAHYGGNISKLARALGLPRSTLRYRLARLGTSHRWSGNGGVPPSSSSPSSDPQLLLPLVDPP